MLTKIAAWNNKIAVSVSSKISTMACVYIFLLWSLLPLVLPKTQDTVFYVSGGILQLVLLPLIMVGQSVMGKDQEERSREDHEALKLLLAEMKQLIDPPKV